MHVLPDVESQPLQLANVELADGVAVSTTVVPGYVAEQPLAPPVHEIVCGESLDVTVPLPLTATDSCGSVAKFAVTTLFADSIVREHELDVPEQAPVQPLKYAFVPDDSAIVTVDPDVYSVQLVPHVPFANPPLTDCEIEPGPVAEAVTP